MTDKETMILISVEQYKKLSETEAYINEEVRKRVDKVKEEYHQTKNELYDIINQKEEYLSDKIRNATKYETDYILKIRDLKGIIDNQRKEIKELNSKNELNYIAWILLFVSNIIWIIMKIIIII